MDRKALEKLVPSETVRKYIFQTGWTFTARQKAVLLYNNRSDLLWQEERLYWQSLKEETVGRRKKWFWTYWGGAGGRLLARCMNR